MRRHTLLVPVVVAATIALGHDAAAAEPPVIRVQAVYEGVPIVKPDGSSGSRTVATKNVLEGKDRLLSTTTTAWDNSPSFRAQASASFFCAGEGQRTGFQQHDVVEVLDEGKNDFVHFQFFPFSLDNARFGPDGTRKQQWLICGVGGMDSDNGSRNELSGPGVAFRSAARTTKIGQAWKEGQTPQDYTINLGFEVSEGPVAVTAGIKQTPHDSLKGSPVGPIKHELTKYKRNAANGWWEADCFKQHCVGAGGSSDYQGSAIEGLYEFPDWTPVSVRDFAYVGWVSHFCSNPFGCRP